MSGTLGRLLRLERDVKSSVDAPVTVQMIGRAAAGEIAFTPRQTAFIVELLAAPATDSTA